MSKQETPLVLAQNFMQRVCQTKLTGFPSPTPRPPPVNERSENLGPEVGQDTSAGTRGGEERQRGGETGDKIRTTE